MWGRDDAQSLAIQLELRAGIVQEIAFLIWVLGHFGAEKGYT